MLERLKHLASNASPESRRQLLYAVTDLFLMDGAPSEASKEHLTHIADRSLNAMATRDRAAYAGKVAPSPSLPQAVAKRLASDPDAAVASVVLKLSPVLTDQDLAAIALTHSQLHLAAIAERTDLPESVTGILVERGDATVLRCVSGNENARLSEDAMARLMARGKADSLVFQSLVQRARRLAPEQARRVLQVAAKVAPQANGAAPAAAVADRPNLQRQAQERRLEVKFLLADLQTAKRDLGEVVTLLAGEDRAFDLAQVIATLTNTPNAQILKALLEPDASAIAVACRSIGLSADGFRAILALRQTRLQAGPRQIERDIRAYEELPGEVSDHAMRFLRMRAKVG
jgi:Uncharacterised protein conserved in bacteria (DUF2336)